MAPWEKERRKCHKIRRDAKKKKEIDRTCRCWSNERRETEGEERAERKSWERTSRVGAFENVISIIARWFYEAVQARNA